MGHERSKRRRTEDEFRKTEQTSSWGCGVRFLGILGVLTVILVVAVVHVAMSDERKTYFDELVSTGGAIRSARELKTSFEEEKPPEICRSHDCRKVAKYINASMDYSKDPCVDFFDYVCGGWIKANPIPKSSSTYSTFAKLNGHVEKTLRHILEKTITRSSNRLFHLPKNFYESCMNLKAIDELNDEPLRELIKDIGSWSINGSSQWKEDDWYLERILLYIHKSYTSAGGPLFSVHISDDPINNTRHIIEVRVKERRECELLSWQ